MNNIYVYFVLLQTNQEMLSKQLQSEKEKTEKEHNELRKQLENVCVLQVVLQQTVDLFGHFIRVFVY